MQHKELFERLLALMSTRLQALVPGLVLASPMQSQFPPCYQTMRPFDDSGVGWTMSQVMSTST